MQLTEDLNTAKFKINAYEPGAITVNKTVYTKSLIISPDQLITDWRPQNIDQLTDDNLEEILNLKPSLILLGTGKQFIMPSHKELKVLHQQKIGVECMDTGAACRTFVALTSEGRNVVAALLID